MRVTVLTPLALGAVGLFASACGGTEDLRPQLESEIPVTTTEPIVYYA